MKHGPVAKLDKINTVTSRKFDDNFMSAYFPIYTNLERFGNRIPDAWSVKITFH